MFNARFRCHYRYIRFPAAPLINALSCPDQLIIMLAARQGRLADIIRRLLDYGEGEDPSGYRAGKSLLTNLKLLLVFWQEHYLHKDKDCSTLEKSSLIPFTFWWVIFRHFYFIFMIFFFNRKETVDLLVSEDHTKTTSILHWIQVDI